MIYLFYGHIKDLYSHVYVLNGTLKKMKYMYLKETGIHVN